MLYVIAVPSFAPEAQEAIAHFRKRHEPDRADLIEPHITLVFGLRGYDPGPFAEFCRQATHGRRRFQVTFDDYEMSFDPVERTYKLMLVCGGGGDHVQALHEALYSGPHRSQLRPDISFRPHMTIGTNARSEALRDCGPPEVGALPIGGAVDAVEVVTVAAGRLTRVARIMLDR